MECESEGPRHRRRWSEADRQAIVAASYAPGMSVSKASRLHNVNANQIFTWRRRLKLAGTSLTAKPDPAAPAFAVVDLIPHSAAGEGAIQIDLEGGVRVRVGRDVDQAALVRVLAALKAVG